MLGISIYPTKSDLTSTIEYIQLAHKYGFKRIFASLLDVNDSNKDDILSLFKKVFSKAHSLDMYITIDANPRVFDTLGVSYQNLNLFKDIGADAIRLDANFDGLTESLVSYGDSGLDVELNISSDAGNIENILSYAPNKQKILGCHNFYPQPYTGLDTDFFMKCTQKYKDLGLHTAAFVSSQVAKLGPHPFNNGLPTLEMHRNLPIEVQAKHLFATGLIDDVIIGNEFASEEELKKLSRVNEQLLVLNIELDPSTTKIEREIILEHLHFNRGDVNSYSIRSTYVKLQYKETGIPKNNTSEKLHPGDVVIGNDSFGQYKGEVNIVKKDIPNVDQHKNVVGKITPKELFLLDYIKPWTKFRFETN